MMRKTPTFAPFLLLALLGCKTPDSKPTEANTTNKHESTPAPKAKPEKKPPTNTPGSVKLFVGGDSRSDKAKVLPWAFAEAKKRGATAFLFLGDMETKGSLDEHFKTELEGLGSVPFYPAIGNHELAGKSRPAAEKAFHQRFLGTKQTPVTSAFEDKVVYSTELAGGVHFVALDNVSQKGFGAEQLKWLGADLAKAAASSSTKHVIVGMHKALAKNGVTKHSMDEDGDVAEEDSVAALALFEKHKVSLIIASHLHEYVKLTLGGIPSYITGGLGAPLVSRFTEGDPKGRIFHHMLEIDVKDDGLEVSMVEFPGKPDVVEHDEDDVK
jgi:hypothetical protein